MAEFSIIKKESYKFTITRNEDGATYKITDSDFYRWNTNPNIEGFDGGKNCDAWVNPSQWGKCHVTPTPSSFIFCNPGDWAGKFVENYVNKPYLLCGASNPNKWVKEYITDEMIFSSGVPDSFSFTHCMSSNPGEWVKAFFDDHPDLIDWGKLAFNTSDWAGKLYRDNLDKVNWNNLLWSCAPWALSLLRKNTDRFTIPRFIIDTTLQPSSRIPFDTFMAGGDWKFPIELLLTKEEIVFKKKDHFKYLEEFKKNSYSSSMFDTKLHTSGIERLDMYTPVLVLVSKK